MVVLSFVVVGIFGMKMQYSQITDYDSYVDNHICKCRIALEPSASPKGLIPVHIDNL